MVTQQSAVPEAVKSCGMDCDHRQLNRFDGPQDPRYRVVLQLLSDIVQKSHHIVRKRLQASKQSIVDDETFTHLSNILNVVDFRSLRKKAESASGDSPWILEEPMYCKWIDRTENVNRFLWISGVEGRGKGKAALKAVENLEKMEKSNKVVGSKSVLVAYFFCDSSNNDSCAPESMLKSLIWQLILKRRNLGRYVRGLAIQEQSRNRNTGKDSVTLSQLWKALKQILSDPAVQSVYFILNNMHGFSKEDESTTKLFELLAQEVIVTSEVDDVEGDLTKARWLFLSRPQGHIKQVLGDRSADMLWIDLEDGTRNETLQTSLNDYIRDRVKELASRVGYSLPLQFYVTSILSKRASSAVWVDIVCGLLEGIAPNHIHVRKTIEALPRSVDDLISNTWRQSLAVQTEGIHTSKEILRTLAIAYQDPTLNELKVMADLELDSDRLDSDKEADQVINLIRACGPLLRIYDIDDEAGYYPGSQQKVTFIHPMAKDALLNQPTSRRLLGFSEDGDDQAGVKLQHGVVSLRCLGHVLKELDVDDYSSDWYQNSESEDKNSTQDKYEKKLKQLFSQEEQETEEDLDALAYPIRFWLQHGNQSTSDFAKSLSLSHNFWSTESSTRNRWWSTYAKYESLGGLTKLTPMHVAAYAGLTPLVDQLVECGNNGQVHMRDAWDCQPLHWAAFQSHVLTMKRLLEIGADVNGGVSTGTSTPLHMAAERGNIDAIKILVEKGARVDPVDEDGDTPLTLALYSNQELAANLLLTYHASPTPLSRDCGESPMALAALKGFKDIVLRLVGAGGALTMTSKEYGSALAAAASAGHLNIVQILLPQDGGNRSRHRALIEAAKNGHQPIVRFLLKRTSDLDVNGAFEHAALLGHWPILQELLSYSQDNIHQVTLNNALYNAVDNEHESIVDLLLNRCGASPNAQGKEYGNAVTASAFDGTTNILEMLLEAGAILEDAAGWPLQAAASQGRIDVIKLLLRRGARVDAVSQVYPDGTALQAAVLAGQDEIAELLLAHGADPNLGSGRLTNPITAASFGGRSSLIYLLLKHNANPNVFGGSDNTTPLINASWNTAAKVLEELIRFGARVNTADADGDTALIISAYLGVDECVECLLRHGADINFCGKNHGTALHAAASEGSVDTCKLLLKMGANPTIRGGSYDTVLQAACYSGEKAVVQLALCDESVPDLSLRNTLLRYKHMIDVNAKLETSEFTTALHAAAIKPSDACLRLLLERKADHGVVDKRGITPLQAASFAGCTRNVRLLLEAGADPNKGGGVHGTVLQAAVLKGSPELVNLLLDRGAKTTEWGGKYMNPLVAAVVRDYHEGDGTEILDTLLAKDFSVLAYRAALEKAFYLGRVEAFKLLWKSADDKGSKNLPSLGLKRLLRKYTNVVQSGKLDRTKYQEVENNNEDFDEDSDEEQYTDDSEWDDSEGDDVSEDDSTEESGIEAGTEPSQRGLGGGISNTSDEEIYGQQQTWGNMDSSRAGNQANGLIRGRFSNAKRKSNTSDRGIYGQQTWGNMDSSRVGNQANSSISGRLDNTEQDRRGYAGDFTGGNRRGAMQEPDDEASEAERNLGAQGRGDWNVEGNLDYVDNSGMHSFGISRDVYGKGPNIAGRRTQSNGVDSGSFGNGALKTHENDDVDDGYDEGNGNGNGYGYGEDNGYGGDYGEW